MHREGRAGNLSHRTSRDSNKKGPDVNSETSRKRKNRGWRNLETSSRIHRRANRRSMNSRTQYGRLGDPGEKMQAVGDSASFVHIAGGSIKYY